MVMWAVCVVLCVCAVVQGATLKENPSSADSSGGVNRRSVTTTESLSEFDWNNIADNIIDLAKADIRQKRKTQLRLPDVQEESSISLGLFTVHYKLKAGEGTVGDLTTFRRTGDVLLSKSSKETLQGDIPISLDRLRVRYGFYEVKVLGLTFSGVLGGTMDTVSFVMTMFGEEVGLGCATTLVGVKIEDLGKLSVDVTGLGALNGVISSIVGFFMEQRRLGVISTIESVLLEEIGKIVNDYQCDELHSLFLLVGN